MVEFVAGRIIFGKVDAADSVPGPGLEKKIENGVWLAAADPLPASVVNDDARVAAGEAAPAVRTPVLVATAVVLAAATRGMLRTGANCAAGFKPGNAATAPLRIPERPFPVPVCADGSI
jgi:hypothetical protein